MTTDDIILHHFLLCGRQHAKYFQTFSGPCELAFYLLKRFYRWLKRCDWFGHNGLPERTRLQRLSKHIRITC